ncbi:MAG: sulfatase [Phycisphaeraceae bacterium]
MFRLIVRPLVYLFALAIFLSNLTASPALAADAKKPNVLFIAVDDLNDWINVMGGSPTPIKTPNFDRLAARGMLFTNAQCAAPACNPSRAALMTGLRPSSTGVYHNDQPWRPAMPKAVTLSQHFMSQGYTALGAGKIFHGGFDDDASWNDYFKKGGDPKPKVASVSGLKKGHFDWGPVDANDEDMNDYRVVSWCIEQLQKPREKPLFLACGIFRPHLPWYVPQKYFDMYPLAKIRVPNVPAGDLKDVPAAGVKIARPEGDHAAVTQNDQWKQAVQGYLASITFADAQLGRLLEALDKSPAKDNTIIVLWGDHGWHLGEKEHWRKFTLWEEAARVPMMIVAPGVTKAGAKCDKPVNLIDLYPTLIELCSLDARQELEGVSIVPLLKDAEAKWDRPSLTTHGRSNHALRSEQWRYIRYADGSEELYDHDSDPNEWKNLAGDSQYSAVKADLAKWLPQKNVPDAPKRGGGGEEDTPKKKGKNKAKE